MITISRTDKPSNLKSHQSSTNNFETGTTCILKFTCPKDLYVHVQILHILIVQVIIIFNVTQ